jgi:organic radical activating enzyme
MKGKISEVFASLQGEGVFFGEKQIFVRFYGCNLNCRYCDTKLDYFSEYEPQELFEEFKLYHDQYHSISFTGGEPLLQKDFLKVVLIMTKNFGYWNYLETNGTLPEALKEVISYLDIVAMDIKLPSSTGTKSFWEEHREFLRVASTKDVFVKSVICSTTKDEELLQAINLLKDVDRSTVLVLQPNSLENNAMLTDKLRLYQDICLKERLTCCVIPQLHRVAGIR